MNLLSYFQWYRRARGGYWAQVTGLFGSKWVRVEVPTSTAGRQWTFYPWAKSEMGNGYIDEWYLEDYSAIPLSTAITSVLGTADPQEIKNMFAMLTAKAAQQEGDK